MAITVAASACTSVSARRANEYMSGSAPASTILRWLSCCDDRSESARAAWNATSSSWASPPPLAILAFWRRSWRSVSSTAEPAPAVAPPLLIARHESARKPSRCSSELSSLSSRTNKREGARAVVAAEGVVVRRRILREVRQRHHRLHLLRRVRLWRFGDGEEGADDAARDEGAVRRLRGGELGEGLQQEELRRRDVRRPAGAAVVGVVGHPLLLLLLLIPSHCELLVVGRHRRAPRVLDHRRRLRLRRRRRSSGPRSPTEHLHDGEEHRLGGEGVVRLSVGCEVRDAEREPHGLRLAGGGGERGQFGEVAALQHGGVVRLVQREMGNAAEELPARRRVEQSVLQCLVLLRRRRARRCAVGGGGGARRGGVVAAQRRHDGPEPPCSTTVRWTARCISHRLASACAAS